MPGFDRLFATMQDHVDAGDIPGAAVRIHHRGTTHRWQSGFRERQSGAALTDDTIFRLASLTKTVTSVMAVQMVAEGKLDLAAVALVRRLRPAEGLGSERTRRQ